MTIGTVIIPDDVPGNAAGGSCIPLAGDPWTIDTIRKKMGHWFLKCSWRFFFKCNIISTSFLVKKKCFYLNLTLSNLVLRQQDRVQLLVCLVHWRHRAAEYKMLVWLTKRVNPDIKVRGCVSLCVCVYQRILLTTEPIRFSFTVQCSFSWVLGRSITISRGGYQ